MTNGFNKLFGNEETKRRLSDAIGRETLPHALLIVGPRGSGKHTMAIEIAAAANCEMRARAGYPLPCGGCSSCKRIYSNNFPDVRTLERSGGKATIGVEELRDFREDMFLSATEARYKFYIIDDADLMTPAAQNALLKVLEEPPAGVHILLLAEEADKILTTIKSRTQYIQTELFGYEELFTYVTRLSETAEGLSKEGDKLKAILLASGGVIGRALSMLDEGKGEAIEQRRARVKDFLLAIPKKAPFSKLFAATAALPQKRDELRVTLEEILSALRDLIVSRAADGAPRLFFLSDEETEEIAGAIGKRRLIFVYDVISEALSDLDKNIITSTLLTDIAVKIKG